MKKLLFGLLATATVWAASGPLVIDFGGQRPPATVQVSSDNTWTQDDAMAFYNPASSATVEFEIDKGTDPSAWTMKVKDRMTLVGGGQGTVFPTYILNGHSVPTQAIPWSEFTSTSYPVGQYLKPGKNVLLITASVTESVNEYQVERITFGP